MYATWDVLFTPDFSRQFRKLPNTRTGKLDELFDRPTRSVFHVIAPPAPIHCANREFRLSLTG